MLHASPIDDKVNMNGNLLVSIPLLPPCYILAELLLEHSPVQVISSWIQQFVMVHLKIGQSTTTSNLPSDDSVILGSQLLAYVIVAIIGYWATNYLIPVIKVSHD